MSTKVQDTLISIISLSSPSQPRGDRHRAPFSARKKTPDVLVRRSRVAATGRVINSSPPFPDWCPEESKIKKKSTEEKCVGGATYSTLSHFQVFFFFFSHPHIYS